MNENGSESSSENFRSKLTEREKKKREERLLYLFCQDPRLKLLIKRAEKKITKKKEKKAEVQEE